MSDYHGDQIWDCSTENLLAWEDSLSDTTSRLRSMADKMHTSGHLLPIWISFLDFLLPGHSVLI